MHRFFGTFFWMLICAVFIGCNNGNPDTKFTDSDLFSETERSSDTEGTSDIETENDTATAVGDSESDSLGMETDSKGTDDIDSGVHVDSETDTSSAEDAGSETDSDSDTDTENEPTIIAPENIDYLLDPYGNAPLAAVVIVSDDNILKEEVDEIRVAVEGITEDAEDFIGVLNPHSDAFSTNFDMTDLHDASETAIPILGLYPDWENHVSITITSGSRQFIGDVTIVTEEIRALSNEEVTVSIADTARIEPGWTFLEDRVYDNDGYCRWQGPRIFRLKTNGNIMNLTEEWNWLGKRVHNYNLPEYLAAHHDSIELPGGNIILCVDNDKSQIINREGDLVTSIEDYVVELNASDEIVNAWDLRAFLDVDRCTFAEKETDWLHMNSLCYDEVGDSLLMSGREQAIVSVTRGGIQGEEANKGKSLKWIFAPHLDWGMSGWDGQGDIDPNDYLLTAVDAAGMPFDEEVQNNLAAPEPDPDAFFWPIGQHGLVITSREGDKMTLMTFNNQASFIFGGEGTIDNGITFTMQGDLSDDRSLESFSQIIEYEIDEAAMTVKKLWSFGEHRPELYGSFTSGVAVLKNTQNRLFITNGMNMYQPQSDPINPRVIEVTLQGEELFQLEITGSTQSIIRAAGRINLYHPEQGL